MLSGNRRKIGGAVIDRIGAGEENPGLEKRFKLKLRIHGARSDPMVTKEQVYEVLQDCYDPEIPVNIVDLGLVYDVEVNDDRVAVKMTLTAPGCGMGTMIAADAKEKILGLEGVGDATVDLVWDPPWSPSMISEEAKQRLGII
jgi:metal-sulfur cluster biosynthetic enzyme